MYRVKIYGAGSIGNHLANASRRMGWSVTVCDVDKTALQRMKTDIYPTRYGQWDETIELYHNNDAPVGGFDLIIVGTPPQHHLPLALEVLAENPKAILIEKPLCKPDLELANELYEKVNASGTKIFVGYDHVVGKATRKAVELLNSGVIGEVKTLDVEFREHWAGIFKAHPWLSGPEDTYLGFWELGGGASGEHSHALNLWQHFAHVIGAGRVLDVDARLNYVTNGKAVYDDLCLLNLKTENGLVGRVVQDVVTLPSRKEAKIQGTDGAIIWVNGYNAAGDAVLLHRPGQPEEVYPLPKTRPDDFIQELTHIEAHLSAGTAADSGISFERGLDTMLVVAAAHLSEKAQRRVSISYSDGYVLDSLQKS